MSLFLWKSVWCQKPGYNMDNNIVQNVLNINIFDAEVCK